MFELSLYFDYAAEDSSQAVLLPKASPSPTNATWYSLPADHVLWKLLRSAPASSAAERKTLLSGILTKIECEPFGSKSMNSTRPCLIALLLEKSQGCRILLPASRGCQAVGKISYH
ncbi:hypothetical protein MRX96_015230 [Rhipicephalus microplus]